LNVHRGHALSSKCLWEVFVWGFGALFVSCVCVSGVVFSVGVCVCVCDLLIFLQGADSGKATGGGGGRLRQVGLYKIVFQFKALLWGSVILLLPPPELTPNP